MSRTTFQRPDFQRMLTDIESVGIRETLEQLCSAIVGQQVSNQLACFIPASADSSPYMTKVWGIELAESVIQKIRQQKGVRVVAGIGSAYPALGEMNKSYHQSLNALHDPKTKAAIRHYSDLFEPNNPHNPFTGREQELIASIKLGDLIRCEDILNAVFSTSNAKLPTLRDSALETVIVIARSIEERIGAKARDRLSVSNLYVQSGGIQTVEALSVWMQNVFAQLIEQNNSRSSHRTGTAVDASIHYIRDNYNEDISLDMVAEQVGISSYYLSRLFKDEVGENFVSYLTALRIQKAKELLDFHNYSIRELSERVGYNNPTYFCKVFKRITGKTVNGYKES